MQDGNLVLVCDTDKGTEMQMTQYYLGKMGYRFFGGKREYVCTSTGLTMGQCRGIDIPTFVLDEKSNADIGICSGDVLEECGGAVAVVLKLPYGKRTLLVYANEKISGRKKLDDFKGRTDIVVQTSWPNTARRYCDRNGIVGQMSTRSGPNPLFYAGSDEPEEIGIQFMNMSELWEDHYVLDSQESPPGALIANPRSYDQYRDRIDGFAHRLRMAITGEGWRLLKFNAPEGDLGAVQKCLPAMKSPTCAKLLGAEGWYAVETALPNGEIEAVIGRLKKETRAGGFLDLELGGVEL